MRAGGGRNFKAGQCSWRSGHSVFLSCCPRIAVPWRHAVLGVRSTAVHLQLVMHTSKRQCDPKSRTASSAGCHCWRPSFIKQSYRAWLQRRHQSHWVPHPGDRLLLLIGYGDSEGRLCFPGKGAHGAASSVRVH
jgi:hypothetical protein